MEKSEVCEEVVVVKVEKEDSEISCSSEDDSLLSPDEDAEVKMEVKDEWQELKKEESEEEDVEAWQEESLVKEESDDESGGDGEDEAAVLKGKRKAKSIESPKKKSRKIESSGTKSKRKRKEKDEVAEKQKKKKAKATPKKKKKDATKAKPPKKKAKKAPAKRKKRKAPAKRKKKPDHKGSPSDDSSSSDSEGEQAAGIQESSTQVIFPLKRIMVGSWAREEDAKALTLKWRLRNEGTKNSEISVEMKGKSKWEAGKRMIFRRLEIDRIKKGRKRGGSLVLLTFELTCPPLFERFMPLPGARGNKWVRTSDFTKGEAQVNKRVRLLTSVKACKKFLKLTKRWTDPILVRSLRDRPQLYWHAMIDSKMAPAKPKVEAAGDESMEDSSVSSESTVMKSETRASDDELTIQSLPAEVLMQIVGYMDAKHVLQSVSLVSRAFHNLSNDDLLWKAHFRRFCGSLVYSVEEAAWDTLPSQFGSWKEALATTNAMCFFRCTYCGKRQTNSTAGRLLGCIVCDKCESTPYCPSLISRTRASKRFGLKDEELVASPLRRLTKYNMHANVVRWFILDEVASYARSLKRGPVVGKTPVIVLSEEEEEEEEEEWDYEEDEEPVQFLLQDLIDDDDDDNDFQLHHTVKRE